MGLAKGIRDVIVGNHIPDYASHERFEPHHFDEYHSCPPGNWCAFVPPAVPATAAAVAGSQLISPQFGFPYSCFTAGAQYGFRARRSLRRKGMV